jgi:hypothetical protein
MRRANDGPGVPASTRCLALTEIKVAAFNCSLKSKKARETSSTEVLLRQVMAEFLSLGAQGEVVRAADRNIKPGVQSDEGAGDAWPELEQALAYFEDDLKGLVDGTRV